MGNFPLRPGPCVPRPTIPFRAFAAASSQVPLVLAVNKCESEKTGELQAADFWQLGMGTPYPVSGIHGTGMGELMDAVTAPLERTIPDKATDGFYNDEEAREAARLAAEREEALDEPLRVAILGKPNVGKSSLLNRLTRTERAIVSDIAGTTRDVIDQKVKVDGTTFLFLDTAGVRRAARVGKGKDSAIETLMVRRALKAVKRSDVCLLVVDATDGVSDQVCSSLCTKPQARRGVSPARMQPPLSRPPRPGGCVGRSQDWPSMSWSLAARA